MTEDTLHQLIDIATRMAQDLQEFVDEADTYQPLPGTKALIDEWELMYRRINSNAN